MHRVERMKQAEDSLKWIRVSVSRGSLSENQDFRESRRPKKGHVRAFSNALELLSGFGK